MGSSVPGTIARFVVLPDESVSKNAKASVNVHWKVPYSSAAKIKSKLILLEIGTNSNSIIDALFVSPIFNPGITDSKSASPGHVKSPSLITPLSGPTAFNTSPLVIISPSWNGHEEPFASKYPIPFVLPKLVPVLYVTLNAWLHSESIKTSVTSSSTLNKSADVKIGGGTVNMHISNVKFASSADVNE